MEKYELQKLRELPIEGVAERLGLTVRMHKALCPFHDDSHPSLSFSVRRNTFRCFVCGAHGGPIDLVMRHLGMGFLDACRWLGEPWGESWGQVHDCSIGAYHATCPRDLPKPFDASRYERFFERPWLNDEARKFLYDERKIDPRVVRWCRLTSWKDKQGVPWLQIPYFDREGRLAGVQNRNLIPGAMPRFRFPQGSVCRIYNLPVLSLLKSGERLFITEGCSDCWAMLSAGHKAIAIPSATLLSKNDVALLQALGSRTDPAAASGAGPSVSFEMFPDRDEPGERLFLQLQQVLPGLVHHQLPPTCKDFSDYYLSTRT